MVVSVKSFHNPNFLPDSQTVRGQSLLLPPEMGVRASNLATSENQASEFAAQCTEAQRENHKELAKSTPCNLLSFDFFSCLVKEITGNFKMTGLAA